jgi:hypothetical protein
MRCSSPGYFDEAAAPSNTTFQTPVPGSVQGLLTLTAPSSAPGVSAVNVARASQRFPARVSRSCHNPGMPSTLVSAAVATPALIPAAARAAAACSKVADQGVVARRCLVGGSVRIRGCSLGGLGGGGSYLRISRVTPQG